MTDLHRRDLVPLFLPPIACVPHPVLRDAYLNVVVDLAGITPRAVLTALLGTGPAADPEALRVLDMLAAARVTAERRELAE